ncbi:ComEC/Rec2 family competence protein [Oleispirillum naphthae]|uniref:ComEC/Rec2 family competence protein n=1 Tax=Oleispirillum naphthae TaxID=2838853 RepID=UPI003082576D
MERAAERFRQAAGWGERAPWLFVAGVAAYLSLAFEPSPAAWAAAVAAPAVCAIPARRGGIAAVAFLALFAVLAGAAWAAFSAHRAAHPVWTQSRARAEVEGRVAAVEMRARGSRVTLDAVRLDGADTPMRVRVNLSARHGAPRPGARVILAAVLYPPPGPAYPGGYDFGRQAWFSRLGAVGYASRAWRETAPPEPWDFAARLQSWRGEAARRILAALPDGDPRAAIAAALIVGERGAIPGALAEAYRASGLAHMLAISGLHMGLLAGLAFLAVRRGLALAPAVALRYPIKKWAAACALVLTAAYLLISGAAVPTQRAFVMAAAALLAVLLERSPFSLRLVGAAALAVAMIGPEAVLGASFQMSFAAAAALIAVYEALRGHGLPGEWPPWLRLPLAYAGGVLLTTLVASVATAPFSLFHFGRLSLYALPANLLALPVLGLWVMPWGLAAALALPFGAAGFPLARMAEGIGWIDHVAAMVSAWPLHQVRVPQMPGFGLALCAAGLLFCALAVGRVRLLGALALAAGVASPWVFPLPDVLIADGGRAVAVRLAEGGYGFAGDERAEFVRTMWRERTAAEVRFGRGWTCGMSGCAVALPSGRGVAAVRQAEGLAAACAEAAVVAAAVPVTAEARAGCGAALLLDAADLARHGAVALWLDGEGAVRRFDSAGLRRGRRPWGGGQ